MLAVHGYRARRSLPWFPKRKVTLWMVPTVVGSLAIFSLSGISELVTAHSYDKSKAIPLLFPFNGGTFHIGHGGGNVTVNYHHVVPAQRYALDVVKLNAFGIRAFGLYPSTLEKYASYGAEVIAPCSGEVISTENDLPDLIPPNQDSKNLAGNHVVLYCADTSVILGHLKKGSVQVKLGSRVEKGAVLAQIGNSGNTSEPHLHIHAVVGKHVDAKALLGTAEGLPMIFNGKFLVRNDRVTMP